MTGRPERASCLPMLEFGRFVGKTIFFISTAQLPAFFLFDDFPFIREFRLLSCYNGNRIIVRWAFAGR
jgi:hypothetical protein